MKEKKSLDNNYQNNNKNKLCHKMKNNKLKIN